MGVLQDNLVLSTGLIMCIGHCKEIRKLKFRALLSPSSENINFVPRVFITYVQLNGKTKPSGIMSISFPGHRLDKGNEGSFSLDITLAAINIDRSLSCMEKKHDYKAHCGEDSYHSKQTAENY